MPGSLACSEPVQVCCTSVQERANSLTVYTDVTDDQLSGCFCLLRFDNLEPD